MKKSTIIIVISALVILAILGIVIYKYYKPQVLEGTTTQQTTDSQGSLVSGILEGFELHIFG